MGVRYYINKKAMVEDCLSIDTFWLRKNDYFAGNAFWGNGKENMSLTISISGTDRSCKVHFVTTPCNYGGIRYWFLCPLIKNGVLCGRRVARLYLPFGANYFGCRHCCDLTYRLRQANHKPYVKLGKMIYLGAKMKELQKEMKRIIYRGKLTKKCCRYLSYKDKIEALVPLVEQKNEQFTLNLKNRIMSSQSKVQ
jgi:hypothetical protein